ncbi:MAG TPA: FGGY family carbohydrate kinase [Chryseolinea sp.]
MNKQVVTLIFDIGKTTKKVLVFDQDFHVLEEQTDSFPEIADEDGFPSEDLSAVTEWVNAKVSHYLNHREFQVTRLNFSTYGASMVHVARDGSPVAFFNYLKPLPKGFKDDFFAAYNTKNDLLTSTASPYLGLLNSGLQFYWLKHLRPNLFSRIATSLHFPQYFPYVLTKNKFSDITSIGCHTMLWDFGKNEYHEWVYKEGVDKLLPEIYKSDKTVDHVYNGVNIKVGVGVHDSSAALMPYLGVMKEKFLLLSTGTWNICFNPFNDQLLSPTELSQDCLCFLTYDRKPVKASRIFLGHEHELQQRELAAYFKVDPEFYKSIEFNPSLYQKLRNENAFIEFKPLEMEGTGPHLNASSSPTRYDALRSFEEAQHQLIRQLVRWQKISIDLLDPNREVKDLIVVGGFTKSKLFLQILKLELPERRILISDHPRATALGAAWLVCGAEAYGDKTHLLNVSQV